MAEIKSSSQLERGLRGVLSRQRLVLFIGGSLLAVAALLTTSVVLSLLANVMVLPVWLKASLLVLTGGVTIYLFVRFAVSRLFHGSVDSVALALEERNPDLKGRLIAAIQFSRSVRHDGFSSDLIRVTEEQALRESGHIDFGEVVTLHPILRTGKYFVTAAALAVIVLLVAPGFFSYAFEVYSHPTTRIAPPVAYQVVAVPGSTEWVKYRDIRIGGAVTGLRLPETAYIHHRLAGGSWQKTRVDLAAVEQHVVESGDSLVFGITLRQINRSFDFFIEAGEITTEVQQIDVVDRPRVSGIKLQIFYPDYTGLSPTTIDEINGSFSAVVGSRVNMKIETNLPIEKAALVFEDSSRTPLTVDGKSAELSMVVDRSKAYRIELLNRLGEKNPDPVEYYITAIPDEYPSIDVIRPGFDVNLNDEMILPLLVRIFDDFGFSSLVMKFTQVSQGRPSEEHVAVLHFSDKIKTEGDVEFNWDMDRLNMYPGDYVTYYFEIADNDIISGPKITASRKYVARIPSLEEILTKGEQESNRRVADTEELIQTGKELSRRLKEAARKLESQNQSTQSAEWQQQKELESIAQKNEEMLQQVEQMADQMEKSLEKMQDNSLMSREIMEKLAEIQKLFQDVATPEMREAQRKLMEALQQMDREEMQKAMKDMELSQEELMQRLERTLALLKKMQVQQKMEAMVRKAEEIVARQKKSNEDTEAANNESLPQLSQPEDENRESLEQLKKEGEDLQKLMAEADMQENPEAQKFSEALEKTDADQNMQQMSNALNQQQKQDAQNEGQKAHSKLLQMLDQMQQAQLALNSDDAEQLRKEMRRAIDHANHLSQEEEDLLREAQTIDPRSMVLRDMAASQQDVREACNGLKQAIESMGRKSPFIAGELQSLVNNAMQNMNLATEGFGEKLGSSAMRHQREAMAGLNRTATRLMESLDQMNQCNNPNASCNSGMPKMESLCNKQNQLNQETQGQCNKPGNCDNPRMGESGRPNQGMEGAQSREGLQRLAGEQGAIRKSLQQLEQEFGGSRQILGRLSDIGKEMEKVEEALLSGEIGPETTERQLQIYSRMLEATRSLQRKDFSEKRRANSATDQAVFVPPSLPEGFLEDGARLEDRLRKFMGKDYPPQYEEQIKAYFKALLKAEAEYRNGQQPTGRE